MKVAIFLKRRWVEFADATVPDRVNNAYRLPRQVRDMRDTINREMGWRITGELYKAITLSLLTNLDQ